MSDRKLAWTAGGWEEDYLYWQGQDRRTLKRINQHALAGAWSRRIDEANRSFRLDITTDLKTR